MKLNRYETRKETRRKESILPTSKEVKLAKFMGNAYRAGALVELWEKGEGSRGEDPSKHLLGKIDVVNKHNFHGELCGRVCILSKPESTIIGIAAYKTIGGEYKVKTGKLRIPYRFNWSCVEKIMLLTDNQEINVFYTV